MWGCIRGIRTPAAKARCRSRREAAWRSIRPPRELRRIGPSVAVVGGTFDRPGYCWRQRDQNDLAAFAPHAQDAVAVLFAEVGDVRPARFEDPQSEQAEKGDESEVVRVVRQPGGGDQRLELQVAEAEGRRLGWDGGTADVVGG